MRIGSRLLERIQSEYCGDDNRGDNSDDSDDDSSVGAVYLDLSDVRYLWNQSKRVIQPKGLDPKGLDPKGLDPKRIQPKRIWTIKHH